MRYISEEIIGTVHNMAAATRPLLIERALKTDLDSTLAEVDLRSQHQYYLSSISM